MSSVNLTSKSHSKLLQDVLKFYIPLGIYSMIMLTSHSVINAGISRTGNSEIALAAYTVSMSIMNMFASPTFTSRQMLVALARDKKSFRISRSVMVKVGIASLSVLSLVAFTPIGKFIFINIFNAPIDLYPEIEFAARFCLLLPFVYTLRAYSQGIIIVQKKTQYLTYSVIVRILFMIFLASFLPKIAWLNGAAVGILIWTLGMGCEALCNLLLSIPLFKKLPEQTTTSDNAQAFSASKAFSFLWPLMLMSFVWTLGRPMINFGLSRTTDPNLSLATFQVAYSFAWILMAFLDNNLRQVTLIFGTSQHNIDFLKRFTLILSVVLAGLLAILTFTPLGTLGLLKIIKVSPELAYASRNILMVLIVAPLLIAWTEFYMGLIMKLGKTKILSIAKIINMITVTIAIYTLAIVAPQIGAIAGAIGALSGIAIEMIVLRLAYFRHLKKQALNQQEKAPSN